MAKIVTTIDGIHGNVKIAIEEDNDQQVMELKWCVFDDQGLTGFLTSFSERPMLVTEVAAEQLIRMVLSSLVKTFEMKPGDLTIVNHMGEHIPDIQFLPPTFDGNEADVAGLITAQDSLRKLYAMYEESGRLDRNILDIADSEGIIDDFLSLVQVRASGVFLAVRKLSQ